MADKEGTVTTEDLKKADVETTPAKKAAPKKAAVKKAEPKKISIHSIIKNINLIEFEFFLLFKIYI